jgi:ADP-heptose:LPS heptosyltransferase
MRILLIRLGMLGDLLGASSAMPILKARFGEDVVFDWIVRPGFKHLFDFDPSVKNVYVLKSRSFFYQLYLWLKHRFSSYDLILNLEINHDLYLFKWIVAKQKSGFPFQKMILPECMHLYELHQFITRSAVGLPHNNQPVLPHLFGASSEKIKEKFKLKKPYLIVAPATSKTGASHTYKAHRNWPMAEWNRFLIQAKKNLPFELVVVGTASDQQYIGSEFSAGDVIVNCMGKTTLPELITLVREAAGVVTCDTGVLHLASAVQTPIFALLGPTDEYRHGPFPVGDPLHTVIRSGVACSPCELTPLHKKCELNVCMQLITPDRVCREIERRLLYVKK